MKFISMIVLIAFIAAIVPTKALADVFQFDQATAQKLDGDITYYKKSIEDMTKLLKNAETERQLLNTAVGTLKEKTEALNLDITTLTKAKDNYKELYTKADDARLKAIEDKPSRATWFGWGALTAEVLGTAAAFAIRK